jgi:hypothetical protein
MTRPIRTLPDFWERTGRLPREPLALPEPIDGRTRLLTDTERATVRVRPLAIDAIPLRNSMLNEAALRVALWDARGSLRSKSGPQIAEALRSVFWPAWRSPRALRGWELLHALDAADLVEVLLDAEAAPTDPLRRRTMRLRERVAEFFFADVC